MQSLGSSSEKKGHLTSTLAEKKPKAAEAVGCHKKSLKKHQSQSDARARRNIPGDETAQIDHMFCVGAARCLHAPSIAQQVKKYTVRNQTPQV